LILWKIVNFPALIVTLSCLFTVNSMSYMCVDHRWCWWTVTYCNSSSLFIVASSLVFHCLITVNIVTSATVTETCSVLQRLAVERHLLSLFQLWNLSANLASSLEMVNALWCEFNNFVNVNTAQKLIHFVDMWFGLNGGVNCDLC